MIEYETVVGLEIHAHLKTESKMFCRCPVSSGKDYSYTEKDEPNVRVCPVCTGQPGTLPAANKKAIEDTILLGLALGSKINPKFNFERKNYFYPDLPKAYQITSSTNPPVLGGGLETELVVGNPSTGSGQMEMTKFVKLDHIHLEEDAGKLVHSGKYDDDSSLVDLNRAGTPLLEIITKPELSSGAEAAEFMRNLQAILRYLGISDADMEKGQMRCDANISVRKKGAKELGAKVEVKNINSFKMVQRAVDFETERQIEVLSGGGKIEQETRGWDDNKGKTLGQRSKEFAHDYRYFPEPDLPPFEVGKGKDLDPEIINDRLPELPKEKKARFEGEYGLSAHDAHSLTANIDVAEYFERLIEKLPQAAGNTEEKKKIGKLTASFMITEFLGKIEVGKGVFDTKVTPEGFSELISNIDEGKISGKMAKEVFLSMLETGKSANSIIKNKGIVQISDDKELNKIVVQVLKENPREVELYKDGKIQLLGFFVGQVMKLTRGQANPKMTNDILRKELSK